MPTIVIDLSQIDDQEILDEFKERNLIESIGDSRLRNELEERGYSCTTPSQFTTNELIDWLEERELTQREEQRIAQLIPDLVQPDVVRLEDYEPPLFESQEDNMKMELVLENLSRFSLTELWQLFNGPIQKTA